MLSVAGRIRTVTELRSTTPHYAIKENTQRGCYCKTYLLHLIALCYGTASQGSG